MADPNVPTNPPGGPTFTQRLWSEEVAIARATYGEPIDTREPSYEFSNGRKFVEPVGRIWDEGNIAPISTFAPVISGLTTVGSALTVSAGSWTGTPVPTLAYQWLRDAGVISGQTAMTYIVVADDVTKTVTCRETATNVAGSSSALSNGIAIPAVIPVNTVAPVISGTADIGETLSSTSGTWSGYPVPTITYQWKAAGVEIPAATGSSYVVVSGDNGKAITCTVTATNVAGSANATSNSISIPAYTVPVNTVEPVVSGLAEVGATLTATTGTWTGYPTPTYTYQWMLGVSVIVGEINSTYVVISNDQGEDITCVVTATNAAGSASSTSNIVSIPAANPDAVIEALFANSEVGAWYDPSDLTTMFQDRAGTTPVTADGQPVGLILDKSKGLVLGAEAITNAADRDFSSDTGFWSKGSSATISGGVVNVSTAVDDYPIYRFNYPTAVGYYEFTYTLTVTSGSIKAQISLDGGGIGPARTSSGTYTDRIYVPATTATFGFRTFGPFVGTIDNVSLKPVQGNHASQATAAKRPLYKTSGGLHWLQFDGVDDALSTASIDFTATDKMSVFSGVRKEGLTAWQQVVELSVNSDNNVGSFGINAPGGAIDGIAVYLKGATGQGNSLIASGYTPPVTSVLTSLQDLAGSTISNSNKIRIDGVLKSPTTGGAIPGGGNYGNYPIYLGARAGVSTYWKGLTYSMIVLGRLATTQEITDTETWVNSKTGAY